MHGPACIFWANITPFSLWTLNHTVGGAQDRASPIAIGLSDSRIALSWALPVQSRGLIVARRPSCRSWMRPSVRRTQTRCSRATTWCGAVHRHPCARSCGLTLTRHRAGHEQAATLHDRAAALQADLPSPGQPVARQAAALQAEAEALVTAVHATQACRGALACVIMDQL